MPQGTVVVAEGAGVQHLDACMLFAVERSHGGHPRARLAPEVERYLGVIEPQPEMILIDRAEGRTRLWSTLASTGRQRVLGNAERLDAEDALHRRRAISFLVGLQITLVPRDAELCMRHLDDEQVVARV